MNHFSSKNQVLDYNNRNHFPLSRWNISQMHDASKTDDFDGEVTGNFKNIMSDLNDSLESSEFDTSTSSVEQSSVAGSRKRKSFSPRRSSRRDDPNFRGVTIFMENKFIDNEWKLLIKSKFSLSPKKKRRFTSYVESSDEEEPNTVGYSYEEKHCASCSCSKTPLWRDAEDGTPLCNACGIRYKKYKIRCGSCWHIPKKDEFSPRCCACGWFYQYVSPRR